MKHDIFKAPAGKFIVVVEDPVEHEAGVLHGIGPVEKAVAMNYVEKINAGRKNPSDCVYWVVDETGRCVNAEIELSR